VPESAFNVLILDDEPGVLELIAHGLRNRGLTTLLCTCGQSAIEQFRQAREAVDLLIADVTLADGSGVVAGVRLKDLKPELKLIFMSGYSLPDWSAHDAALVEQLPPESVRVLRKPFTNRDLLSTVGELLGVALQPRQAREAAKIRSGRSNADRVVRRAHAGGSSDFTDPAVEHGEIAALASSYWTARGFSGGSAEEDWYRAEEELRRRMRAGSAGA
jgi:DNA-binding NtrC family response regulator